MRSTLFLRLMAAAGLLSAFAFIARPSEAANPEVSATLAPVRQVIVDGDKNKFRADHWMKDDYTGGLKDFSLKYNTKDGTEISSSGHAIIDQNDLGADISVKKPQLGYINFNYSEFRKYYDNSGGTYYPFTRLSGVNTDKELALNVGKFGFETGMTIEGWPQLSFGYERDFKKGAKSRLTWTSAVESVTRNIGPSWQDIDEHNDVFTLKGSHELAGFSLKGEQRWEFTRTETMREEDYLSTSSTPTSANKIRRQEQDPESNLATSTLQGERYFLDDKLFFASAYRYAQIKNREFETLSEYNVNGVLTNYSNPKQYVNARADNKYHTHTWVQSAVAAPWSWLSIGTKFKTEVLRRRSNSSYPADAVPNSSGGSLPNSVIDRFDNSITDNKAVRWGEGFSLRYSGIPRTALYNEVEFEQVRVLLREDRKSIDGPDVGNGISADETSSRQTISRTWRGVWTLGGQFAPVPFFDVTANVRHRQSNIDYDNQQHTDPGATTARSAFFDGQNVATEEFETRATVKPCRWFRSSFRYQLRNDKLATRTVAAEQIVKTGVLSNTYTFDVTVQPLEQFMTTASFSRQVAAVTTPADLSATANTPTFNSNTNMWLLSTEYFPHPKVTVTSTLEYSHAADFNDFSANGLPLGVDFSRTDIATGVKFAVTENVSLGTDYAFYHYKPNDNAEAGGGYNAHVIGFDATVKF